MFRLLGLHPGPDITVPAAASLAGLPLAQARGTAGRAGPRPTWSPSTPPAGTPSTTCCAPTPPSRPSRATAGAERGAAVRRVLDHYLHTACRGDRLLNPASGPDHPGAAPSPAWYPRALADYGRRWPGSRPSTRCLLAAVALRRRRRLRHPRLAARLGPGDLPGPAGHWHDWAATQRTALAAAQRLGDQAAQALAHRALGHARAHARRPTRTPAPTSSRPCASTPSSATSVGQAHAHINLASSLRAQGRYADGPRPHASRPWTCSARPATAPARPSPSTTSAG